MKLYRFWFLLLFTLSIFACSRGYSPEEEKASPASQPPSSPASTEEAPSGAAEPSSTGAAGIEWTYPSKWQLQAPRPMRVATYSIPAAAGDPEDGECAVFFFGSGQGGDVRSNIDRWVSQFETDSKPEEASQSVNGIQVTTVSLGGTYLAPGGPMMQSQGKKPNYRLLGAIVEAPEGAVFFKTTGPATTVEAAADDFDALIHSIRKAQ